MPILPRPPRNPSTPSISITISFPPIHNSHPSLPLYDPNEPVQRPPPSTRFKPGYSQFEVGSSSLPPPRHAQVGVNLPPFPSLPPISITGASLVAPNITNPGTVRLSVLEDFLTWHTQFMVILVSHGLLCFVDGLYPLPTSVLTFSSGESIPNSNFYDWMPCDQSIRS